MSFAKNNTINISLEQTEAEKFKTFSAVKNKSIGLSAIRARIEIFNMVNERKSAVFEIRKKHGDEGAGTVAVLTLPKIFGK